ncbi:MAG: hypothetical protein KDD64_17590, partial [Bdellovibrionales bacterium]|nr:hypothetical protein [Bdellovibrionales bacterium]
VPVSHMDTVLFEAFRINGPDELKSVLDLREIRSEQLFGDLAKSVTGVTPSETGKSEVGIVTH